MEHKSCFFIILCCIQIFFTLLWFFTDLTLAVFLSYETAFFNVLLIVFCSYLHYKKNVLLQAKRYNITQAPLMIFVKKYQFFPKIVYFRKINDDLTLSLSEKWRHFSFFFAFFKLCAYGLLAVSFLFLQHRGLLNVFGYLCGISSLLVCIFIFLLYVKYESKKNH
ncbi:hypothetical protein OQH60_02545 [Campylobacter sp. MIT 21-1685]|uniref:hypothetical protein n=1 Tax=unclassified Campylobacter TaxID=2593542 RepID=UPI00224B2454|nr:MULTISPECIES: hypothetical protein [unclassified Campylobacter]MCX2682748.1 hypothetical protein [Campylobacter sp. MIT 21-1684]MCX2751106.1 hypothetical protein [Campylobacter sp. MIT 21-1682]MCX2807229.1 hypothetical protein [Campylobacter sp. MIT 21-1685]